MALLEKKILLGFYEFWLIVSVLFILSQGFNTYVLCHLYFVLAVPLLGIWLLYKDKNITYICIGFLFSYLIMQILYSPWLVQKTLHWLYFYPWFFRLWYHPKILPSAQRTGRASHKKLHQPKGTRMADEVFWWRWWK